METITTIKRITTKIAFLAAMIILGSMTNTYAKALHKAISNANITADTLKEDIDRSRMEVQKSAFEKAQSSLEQRSLLDNLSKISPQDPEVFTNEKEEYIWFQKAKEQGDAYEKAIKQLNELISKQTLW